MHQYHESHFPLLTTAGDFSSEMAYYLPREFTAIVIVAVYIPPSENATANSNETLQELHDTISEQKMALSDAVFIITGDFNQLKLESVAPK